MQQISNIMWEGKFCWLNKLKKMDAKKQIRWAVYKRNTRNNRQCRSTNKEYPTVCAVSVKFLKNCKISIMNILSINEDYMVTTIFSSMLLNGLLVLVAPNFRNWSKKCQKEKWMFSEEVLHVCEEERWHTFDLQKIINEIHLRAAIDRFLQSLPLEKRFPLSLTPLSPRQIKH